MEKKKLKRQKRILNKRGLEQEGGCARGGGGEPEDEMKRKRGGDNGTEGERLVRADLAKRCCLDMENTLRLYECLMAAEKWRHSQRANKA